MLKKLQKIFGFREFRPFQEAIIADVLKNKDTLALIPTGGGKSLCYQYPAMVREGLTVVISPLIALMKDQVDDLQAKRIPAAYLNSTLERREAEAVKERIRENRIKILYVAPERAVMPGFLEFLRRVNVNLFAIDEAHCISEWGHDFRPDDRKLDLLRNDFPAIPVLALTSTAVDEVQEDIMVHLRFRAKNVHKTSFDRPNLFYSVIRKGLNFHESVIDMVRERKGYPGIVYCFSRKAVESICGKLNSVGLSAVPYHAGLSPDERIINQERFAGGEAKIIVATIAFGMGIDKADIRYVIHADMPKSVEGYFQETGRAGRDGHPSECILFYGPGDRVKQEYFIRQIEDGRHQAVSRQKLKKMVGYCSLRGCRRRFLLAYFSEDYAPANCGTCDVCQPHKRPADIDPAPALPIQGAETIPAGKAKTRRIKSAEYDAELYALLRTLRNEIAERQFKKPFMVFPNQTLKEMAKHKPESYVEFARVKGVGGKKIEQYGDIFVGFISRYAQDPHSVRDAQGNLRFPGRETVPDAAVTDFWIEDEDRILQFGYKRGKSINEIARFLDRTPEEVRKRLAAKKNLTA